MVRKMVKIILNATTTSYLNISFVTLQPEETNKVVYWVPIGVVIAAFAVFGIYIFLISIGVLEPAHPSKSKKGQAVVIKNQARAVSLNLPQDMIPSTSSHLP
uniref:Uncharacterized protein n=1 Tax=Ciona intestinalis TaxID=7719 RepID=H2XKR5_CIOIN